MTFNTPVVIPQLQTQPSPWDSVDFFDFSGGMAPDLSASTLPENQFSQITNMFIDKNQNALITRDPLQPYQANTQDSILTTAPLELKWIELDNISFLLVARSTGSRVRIEEFDEGTGNWGGILTSNLIDDNIVEIIKWSANNQEDAIICNGANTPLRWIGISAANKATDLGLVAPDSSAANKQGEASASRGLSLAGTYHYKVTFEYNSTTNTQFGESQPSDSFAIAVTAATTVAVTLQDMPALTSDISLAFVYRSPVNVEVGPFERVGFYTTGTEFVDSTPNGEEGVEPPDVLTAFPKFKHPVQAGRRLWAVDGAIPSKLVWTEENNIDVVLTTSFFFAPDSITGIAAFRKSLYFMTEEELWFIQDSDPSNIPVKIAGRGCVSHRSIVNVGIGLIWHDKDNVLFFDHNNFDGEGEFPIPIGDGIRSSIEKIAISRRENSVAEFHQNKYILSISQSSTVNDTTFVFATHTLPLILSNRLVTAGWTQYSWFGNDIQSFKGVLYHADNANLYIQEHGQGSASRLQDQFTFNGSLVDIATEIKTKTLHLTDPIANKHFSSLTAIAETSTATLDAILSLNAGEFTKSARLVLSSETAPAVGGVWGTGLWGTMLWGGSNFNLRNTRAKFKKGAVGKNAQLTVSSTASGDTKIIGLSLHYKSNPRLT